MYQCEMRNDTFRIITLINFALKKIGCYSENPLLCTPVYNGTRWFPGRAVRHSSAKAATAVRIRWKPL